MDLVRQRGNRTRGGRDLEIAIITAALAQPELRPAEKIELARGLFSAMNRLRRPELLSQALVLVGVIIVVAGVVVTTVLTDSPLPSAAGVLSSVFGGIAYYVRSQRDHKRNDR